MASIKIATGLKTYDIEDQNGNVRGQISFNPSDMNFIKRLASMEDKLNEYLKEYTDVTDDIVDSEATESQADDMIKSLELIVDYDTQVKRIINETFEDDRVSDVVFGKENCFNIYNGKTFVERFIDGIVPVIKTDVEAASKELDDKMSKYTAHTYEK